ncbi:MAG: hypothetical protein PHR70_09390 [Tissierellia bacterium]|nr:hypothetical protein [Tissierellia bacterium]
MFVYNGDLNFNMDMIIQNMGYKSDNDLPESILCKLEESIDELKDIITPKTNWGEFPFQLNKSEKRIEFDNNLNIQDKGVFDGLCEADEIVVAIGTLGNLFDEKLNKYIAKNDYLKVIIYDAIGKAVYDCMQRDFEFYLGKKYDEKGMGKTNGFYPGINGWDLKDQKLVFSFFDKDFLDVKLNESYIMTPAKSFSAIYGIGEKIITKVVDNKCVYCNLKDCRFRKKSIAENC